MESKLLPGQIGTHLFKCYICGHENNIFRFQFYGGYVGVDRAAICHICVINLVMQHLRELQQKETSHADTTQH